MRTYVSTMGFHETRVTRPILRHKLDDGDRVVLLRPATEPDPERGDDAVAYVQDMLHEIAPEATVSVERIPHDEFERAVFSCCDILRDAEGELVVNFGGGAREIYLPLTIAALVHAADVDMALQYTDVDQSVREWAVPRIDEPVPEGPVETLRAVAELGRDVPMPEVHEAIDRSKSTASRHVSTLEDAGLVETEMRGKTKHVSPTLGGRLRLRQRE